MRRALGFAVVLAAFVTPLSISLTPSVAAGSLGLDALDTCLAQKSSLSVLFLVDTSQSLKQTDPTAQRVQGLQAALRALSTLKTSTEAAKQSLSIFVDFLEFGSISRRTFADSPEWQPLPDDSSALETAVSVYANKTQAEDTDYVSALEPWADRSAKPADQIGALELLGRAPADSCRLVVWFTDGKLELDYQHTPKTLHWVDPPIQLDSEASQKPAEAAARDELCKSGGLADRLRTGDLSSGEGAALAVVGLGSSTSFDLISSIAQGSGQGGPCGSAAARGVFLPADSLDLLSFDLITAVLGRGDGSPVGTTGIGSCAAADPLCTSKDPQVQVFDFPFVLNGGLVKFNLVTLAGDPSVTATLISPDMSEYELGKTESTVLPNGVALQVANVGSSGAVHQIDATLPGDQVGWQGLWRVRYRTSDPAKAAEILNKAAIFVFGNLQAKLLGGPPLRVGKTGTITVSLVSAAGQPATDTAFATGSKLIVTANGQALPTPAINADGTFVYPYTVPDGFTGDSIALSATLDPIIRLSSDAPDVHLPTWQGDLGTINVLPVSKFPFITLKSSSLGTFDQKHRTLTTTVEIDATAPDSGGCVSVGTAFTFLPFKGMKGSPSVQLRDGSTRIDDHASCAFKINTGEKKDITLVVSLGHATFVSEGTLQASGVLHSVNATDGTKNGDAPIVVSAKIIPITISTTDWGKVVLYTIFAVLIPILLLFIYNVFTAKLAVGESQRESAWLLELPTRLRDGRLVRLDGVTEVPLVADDDDFRRIPGPGTSYARSVDAGKVAFRARIPMSPFGDIVAVVDGGDASFVVGPLGSTRRGSRGKMPLTTVRAWGFTSSETPVRIKDTAALEPLDGTLSILLPFSMSRAREEVATIRPDLDEIIQSSALRSATVSAPERASEEPDIEAHADRKRRRIRPSKTESPKAPKNANEDPFGDTNERDGDPFGDNSSGRVDRNRSSSSNDDGSDSAGGSRSDDVPF